MDQQQLQTLVDGVIRGIFVELEASGRHVHVTKDQAMELFGHELTPLLTWRKILICLMVMLFAQKPRQAEWEEWEENGILMKAEYIFR